MTIDEQIEILQAFKEGKRVYYYSDATGRWEEKKNRENPIFDFQNIEYRIVEPEKTLEEEVDKIIESGLNASKNIATIITEILDKRYQRVDK